MPACRQLLTVEDQATHESLFVQQEAGNVAALDRTLPQLCSLIELYGSTNVLSNAALNVTPSAILAHVQIPQLSNCTLKIHSQTAMLTCKMRAATGQPTAGKGSEDHLASLDKQPLQSHHHHCRCAYSRQLIRDLCCLQLSSLPGSSAYA